ncbi:MAG TPA: hypothetical protein VK809_06315 [Bacteroidia bacterium]|jgi:hypothetical protein|nr:hypothetical protein [Bacteroidia bacterium]
METQLKQWTCPICQDIKKAQGRGAHLRQAHELKITKITDEELKLALEKNISLKDPELKSKLMLEHKLNISTNLSAQLAETSENIKVSPSSKSNYISSTKTPGGEDATLLNSAITTPHAELEIPTESKEEITKQPPPTNEPEIDNKKPALKVSEKRKSYGIIARRLNRYRR